MNDVRIDQLQVTVEVGGLPGDEEFARLFNMYIRRWHELQRQASADRRFLEAERAHPRGAMIVVALTRTPDVAVSAAGQNLVRAYLRIDTPLREHRYIPLHFNPAEYQVRKAQTFAEIAIPGLASPPIQWVRGGIETLSFEALVDSAEEGTSVDTRYVASLRSLLDVDKDLHAPPIVAFVWGPRTFRGVLDGLSTTYLLFDSQGVPLRAKLSITLKEYRPVRVQVLDVKTSPDVEKTYLVRRGDTLSSIAAAVYKDPAEWRHLARANAIRDPRTLAPGRRLLVPRLVR